VKLLRALQDRKIQRLGGIGVIPVDVRIIAATNRNLEESVSRGEFREDLYYRINVIRAKVPPLRERPADIPYLAELFLESMRSRGRAGDVSLSPAALDILSSYRFPGNVRELENMIERAVILADSPFLMPRDFMLPGAAPAAPAPASGTLREMEIAMIRQALYRNEGRRENTAAELGITRKTLLNKMKAFGLEYEPG
jgi:two-component system response regulator AtoC